MTETVCENCAIADDELLLVRRVYVTPEQWDSAGGRKVSDEVEMWCVSCATQYPNEPADPDADAPA